MKIKILKLKNFEYLSPKSKWLKSNLTLGQLAKFVRALYSDWVLFILGLFDLFYFWIYRKAFNQCY